MQKKEKNHNNEIIVNGEKTKFVAIFDFQAVEVNELSLVTGDEITLIEEFNGDWYKGEKGGKVGIFPKEFVEPLLKETKKAGFKSLRQSLFPQSLSKIPPVLRKPVAAKPPDSSPKNAEVKPVQPDKSTLEKSQVNAIENYVQIIEDETKLISNLSDLEIQLVAEKHENEKYEKKYKILKEQLTRAVAEKEKYSKELDIVVIEKQKYLKELKLFLGEELPQTMEELNEFEGKVRKTLQSIEHKKSEFIREQKLCVICSAKEKSIALAPCRHMCVCSNCATSLKQCPLCRQPIKNRMKIFI